MEKIQSQWIAAADLPLAEGLRAERTEIPNSEYRLSDSQRRYIKWKRLADCLLSFLCLVLLALPFLILGIIQKINSPREPVFFIQERVGLEEKRFRIIKFRTMHDNSCTSPEEMDGFSHFLRKTSIDELPQLINVLFGDMSLIGPRPLIPEEETIQRYRSEGGIYCVRPGITGWAQINGRALLTDMQKYAYDREYVEKLSCRFDLNILVKTVGYILKQRDVE